MLLSKCSLLALGDSLGIGAKTEAGSASKIEAEVDFVLIILSNTQVAARHRQRAMVVNLHDNSRRHPTFPCVVAESLAERMARDADLDAEVFRSAPDDAVSLDAAYGLVCIVVYDDRHPRFCRSSMNAQRFYDGLVKCDDFALARLFFKNGYGCKDTLILKVVDIIPRKPQDITDAQCRMDADCDQDMVSDFTPAEEVFHKLVDMFPVSDRFCSCHFEYAP